MNEMFIFALPAKSSHAGACHSSISSIRKNKASASSSASSSQAPPSACSSMLIRASFLSTLVDAAPPRRKHSSLIPPCNMLRGLTQANASCESFLKTLKREEISPTTTAIWRIWLQGSRTYRGVLQPGAAHSALALKGGRGHCRVAYLLAFGFRAVGAVLGFVIAVRTWDSSGAFVVAVGAEAGPGAADLHSGG